tara:strand:- start:454 stop:834 length:381 start_codon:yes stop_codon:yes gene_type:complete
MSTTFRYNKEMIYAEFEQAKQKDISLSKKKTLDEKENDIFTNRIAMLKEHSNLKFKQPEIYDGVNINFNGLLVAYQSPSPRDHFYRVAFGKSFAEHKQETEITDVRDYSISDEKSQTLEEKVEAMV